MRIALDITPLFQDEPTGIAYYCASVVNALVEHEQDHEYVLFGVCPRGLRHSVTAKLDEIAPRAQKNIIFVPQKAQQPLLGLLQRLPLSAIDAWIGQVDVFHQFDAYSLASSRIVTATVFDLSALKFPHMHTRKNLSIQLNRMKFIKKRSQHFFTISNTIKKELMKAWQLPGEVISVAYPSIDNRQALVPACNDFACIRKNQDLFSVVSKGAFFLHVATREPRKNLETLLAAFRLIDKDTKKHHPLVMVGASGWGQDQSRGSREFIWAAGFLCDRCLEEMYARAHALVYVPHYEGFGMPIAEAMKAKLPVICSNIPVFREIANEAAIFVDAQNAQDIQGAMEKSIAMTEKERAHMVALGSQKSALYSARACASVMVSAWVRLVQSGHENRDF
jgi:alpha-1,3-rhamnosyl/mannosyltransferase